MSLTRALSESQGLSSNFRQQEELEAHAPWPDPERWDPAASLACPTSIRHNGHPERSAQCPSATSLTLPNDADIHPAARRYEILPLPAHLHPVLVFVNGRSGNQDGTRIARRLRRVLHPLQVCNRRAHASQRAITSLHSHTVSGRPLPSVAEGAITLERTALLGRFTQPLSVEANAFISSQSMILVGLARRLALLARGDLIQQCR
jgi:hypothetical protein